MRKRTHRVQFMLSDSEYLRLCRNAAKSGFKQAGYLRSLVNGYVPKELPPLEYYAIINKLYLITDQLNRIERLASEKSTLEKNLFRDQSEITKQMILALQEALIDSRRST